MKTARARIGKLPGEIVGRDGFCKPEEAERLRRLGELEEEVAAVEARTGGGEEKGGIARTSSSGSKLREKTIDKRKR